MTATTKKYTTDQLIAMQAIVLDGKANAYQAQKYEFVRQALLAEIAAIEPKVAETCKDRHVVYLAALADRVEWEANRQERINQAQARANMQTAHNQLANYK